MKEIILSLISIIALFGCKTGAGILKLPLQLDPNNKSKTQTTLFWAHYNATQRGGLYMVTDSGKVVVISEPPPDAGVNSMLDVLAKANVKEVEAGAKVSAVKSIAELGKRNAANYVVRDIAFRIESLLNNNHGILSSEVVDMYKTLLSTAKEISISESKTDITKSKADILKEVNGLIEKARDTTYKNLKLDSTFFKSIQKQIGE